MKLPDDFSDKTYRDEFVSAGIDNGIAFQIFAMREQRKWSQETLATKAVSLQPVVSRWEKPGHRFSLATLKKVAAAFEVALIVRFVPFSELAKLAAGIRPGSFEVLSYEDELKAEQVTATTAATKESATSTKATATWLYSQSQFAPVRGSVWETFPTPSLRKYENVALAARSIDA